MDGTLSVRIEERAGDNGPLAQVGQDDARVFVALGRQAKDNALLRRGYGACRRLREGEVGPGGAGAGHEGQGQEKGAAKGCFGRGQKTHLD